MYDRSPQGYAQYFNNRMGVLYGNVPPQFSSWLDCIQSYNGDYSLSSSLLTRCHVWLCVGPPKLIGENMNQTMINVIEEESMVPLYKNRICRVYKPGGPIIMTCPCGTPVQFYPSNQTQKSKIVVAFCCNECYNRSKNSFIPVNVGKEKEKVIKMNDSNETVNVGTEATVVETTEPVMAVEPATETSAPSPSKTRSAAMAPKAERGNCPECGGEPGRARGWKHTASCTLKAPTVKDPSEIRRCSVCNGPAKGRGFRHEAGCSAKPIPAVATVINTVEPTSAEPASA